VADRASDIRQRTVLMLEEMGIPVEHAQHEDAPSQHEIDLRYTDALTMADTVMTVRLVVKEMARQQGVFASFMPKPLAGVQGSGMHTHMSLFRGRHQRLRRPRPTRTGCPRWPRVHRRPAAPRPRDHRRHQPVGQLLQAPGRRLRGPIHVSGPATTARPWSGCRWSSRASPSRPGSSTGLARQRLQPRTWPSPSSWPPACSARLNEIAALEPTDGFSGAVINAAALPFSEAMSLCRQLRQRERGVGPIILLLDHYQLDDLTFREDLFDDFVVGPYDVSELATRLRHRLRRAGNESVAPRIEHAELSMNLETYQASIAGRVMDLTYMEYELLRFLATNPNRVFTRATLLSRVWGYEYYGGARTVDVHVRRLRAKLGEEYAHLIQTVRSVGYKFGTSNEFVDQRAGE
jgi:two-component system alkaline phosphatase synthesis response regulator PhoP